MTTSYISLLEAAELELTTAETELAHARDELKQFIRENCFMVDQRPVLTGPALRRAAQEQQLKQLQLAHEVAGRKLQAALERVSVCSKLKAGRG